MYEFKSMLKMIWFTYTLNGSFIYVRIYIVQKILLPVFVRKPGVDNPAVWLLDKPPYNLK